MNAINTEPRAEKMRELRRQQILTAAKEVFAERGYHGASINDIIRKASIARGTFYLYFSSKHTVFNNIIDEALVGLNACIKPIDISSGARPPQVQLRECVVRVIQYLMNDRDFTLLLFSHQLSSDKDVAKRVAEFDEHVIDLISASLNHGVEMGIVRPCEPDLIAPTLLGAVRGLVLHLLTTDDVPVEKVVDELLMFSLRGVLSM